MAPFPPFSPTSMSSTFIAETTARQKKTRDQHNFPATLSFYFCRIPAYFATVFSGKQPSSDFHHPCLGILYSISCSRWRRRYSTDCSAPTRSPACLHCQQISANRLTPDSKDVASYFSSLPSPTGSSQLPVFHFWILFRQLSYLPTFTGHTHPCLEEVRFSSRDFGPFSQSL